MTKIKGPAREAFEARDDLTQYGSNAQMLFATQVILGVDDIKGFAANALTDGPNDRKCDMVAVDRETQTVVVAQAYESTKVIAGQIKPNKAADLSNAITWLLAGDTTKMNPALSSAAEDLRSALDGGEINNFYIWFVHNQEKNENLYDELDAAASSAKAHLSEWGKGRRINVSVAEIDWPYIEQEYEKLTKPILVSDSWDFTIPGGYGFEGDGWEAFSTLISTDDLRNLWNKYGVDLLSPNVRDYLGTRRSEDNINHGIKETAKTEPRNFSIFHNGITVIANDFKVMTPQDSDGNEQVGSSSIHVDGLGIINGGQTTGALGSLSESESNSLQEASVMARFVKCQDPKVLENIVRFNNTQNKIEPADFRSNDPKQKNLRKQFEDIPDAVYNGGRRGGVTDAILRKRNVLPDTAVAQSLAAFHGDPNLAYNKTRIIWEKDDVYSSVFNDLVTARHIVFVYGLLDCIREKKESVRATSADSPSQKDERLKRFFSHRGSTLVLVSALGASMETVLNYGINDRNSLRFKNNISPADARRMWAPIVEVALAFSEKLEKAASKLGNSDIVKAGIAEFVSMLEATAEVNATVYSDFAKMVEEAGSREKAAPSETK